MKRKVRDIFQFFLNLAQGKGGEFLEIYTRFVLNLPDEEKSGLEWADDVTPALYEQNEAYHKLKEEKINSEEFMRFFNNYVCEEKVELRKQIINSISNKSKNEATDYITLRLRTCLKTAEKG